jgi:hypothetical protein
VSARAEDRSQRRDAPADTADRVPCATAHRCVQLKPGRAGEK